MVDRPGTCRVTPSGPGRSARGCAYGGEAPRGSVDPGLDEPELARAADRLLARGGAELGVDVAHVGLDGVDRDEQLLADLAVRVRAREQPQHGELALGELLRAGWRGSAHVDAPLEPGEPLHDAPGLPRTDQVL